MHAGARQGARAACWAVLACLLLALLPSARASDYPIPESSTRPLAVDVATGRSAFAELGTFDCDRLRVGIRLDNTGSTRAVRFGYTAAFVRPLHAPYSGQDARVDVDVAAGATRTVELPVRNDARTTVTVHLPGGRDANWQSTCGNAPGAIFGPSDCATLRMGVLLDNRTSRTATRFRWSLGDPTGLVATKTVEVDAGAVAPVDVPIVANGWTAVEVSVEGRGTVARLNRQACGWVVLDPRAVFGVVDCRDVSVPVLLDNARSSTRLRFHLPGDDVVLDPGQTRSLRLHVPIRELLAVTVDDVLPRGRSVVRAVTSTAHCAATPVDSGAAVPTADPAAAPGGPAAVAAAGAVAASRGERAAADATPASVTAVGVGVLVVLVALALLVVMRRRWRAAS
ncbi:MAG: hypothetical protein ACJ710_15240 [Ornithinibacter sp.]